MRFRVGDWLVWSAVGAVYCFAITNEYRDRLGWYDLTSAYRLTQCIVAGLIAGTVYSVVGFVLLFVALLAIDELINRIRSNARRP